MLEDIKNVMSSKRPNSDSNVQNAFIQEIRTGRLYEVKIDSEFVIGRALCSTVVIGEIYVSRSQSFIRYENGQYLLRDNNAGCGTYLNYRRITKTEVPLKHGDLIAYTDKPRVWDFVYKFCLVSNPNKKSRLNGENSATEDLKKLKTPSMHELLNLVKELKDDNEKFINDTKIEMDKLNKMIKDATELNDNMNKEMIKLQNNNQELNNELTICREKCAMQKELLDVKTALKEEPVEIFKNQINKLLENDFQCSICNEVMYRASTANCNHSFCESCLKKWLTKSKFCPVCRGVVQNITYCLALDNYITNICDVLGGTIKEQRVILKRESKNF
uniref:E3 ubiquitin-protein ligase CHFR n=1 Tax=Melanaphis sacchari TaxID=742174 RepID=A0A2H8THV2_9HEMI